jgi:hypothetical protein
VAVAALTKVPVLDTHINKQLAELKSAASVSRWGQDDREGRRATAWGQHPAKETALNESCEVANGYGDTPEPSRNSHRIDARRHALRRRWRDHEFTCDKWTKGDDTPPAVALVGHHDRTGQDGLEIPESARCNLSGESWNHADQSKRLQPGSVAQLGRRRALLSFAID